MTASHPSAPAPGSSARAAESVFARIVVGVDGSEQGFEACRQAASVARRDTRIEAVAVVHLSDAVHAAFSAAEIADRLQLEAEHALEEAGRILGGRAETRFVNGFAVPALIREIEARHATLVALGSHGHSRLSELLLGGVAGDMLHAAPCSVLIARPRADAADGSAFPRSIVVGIDGSEPAALALDAAGELAERLGAELRAVAASGGKGVDLAGARVQAPLLEEVGGRPVSALVEAARETDLLVVGSRGLHGFGALGSVSERVAHEASCSVLVVRQTSAVAASHA